LGVLFLDCLLHGRRLRGGGTPQVFNDWSCGYSRVLDGQGFAQLHIFKYVGAMKDTDTIYPG
jgi:hypothetical protein